MSKLIVLYAKNASEIKPGTYQCDLDTTYLSNIKAIALKTLTFINNEYNLFTSGTNQNNEFKYEIDSVEFTETIIVAGYYTTQQVIDLLVAKIQGWSDEQVKDKQNCIRKNWRDQKWIHTKY